MDKSKFVFNQQCLPRPGRVCNRPYNPQGRRTIDRRGDLHGVNTTIIYYIRHICIPETEDQGQAYGVAADADVIKTKDSGADNY